MAKLNWPKDSPTIRGLLSKVKWDIIEIKYASKKFRHFFYPGFLWEVFYFKPDDGYMVGSNFSEIIFSIFSSLLKF